MPPTAPINKPAPEPEPKPVRNENPAPEEGQLQPAGSSADGRVHYLLAERQTVLGSDLSDKADRIAAIDAELAGLGVSV